MLQSASQQYQSLLPSTSKPISPASTRPSQPIGYYGTAQSSFPGHPYDNQAFTAQPVYQRRGVGNNGTIGSSSANVMLQTATSTAPLSNNSQQTPMAAPPLPSPPPPQPTSNSATPPVSNPPSPGGASASIEQQRIGLLFNINISLLREVSRLQSLGQGGATTPAQQKVLREQGQSDKLASEEYIQCLRRVQANLTYLMPRAQQNQQQQSKIPPGPAHMSPPPHMPQLLPMYEKLKELFPGWGGVEGRMNAQAAAAANASPGGGNVPGSAGGSAGAATPAGQA